MTGRGALQDQHYHALGLKVGAPEVEIKSAFKTLALQHHPDKGGDPEKFKEVSMIRVLSRSPSLFIVVQKS